MTLQDIMVEIGINFDAFQRQDIVRLTTYIKENQMRITSEVYRSANQIILDLRKKHAAWQSEIDELVTELQVAYDTQYTILYGFPVVSLEYKLGISTEGLSELMLITDKELGVGNALIPVRGDNNCGPRAIIQSLLLRGITTDQRAKVSNFLRTIYNYRHESVEEKIRAKSKSEMIITQEEFDNFISEYNVQNLNSFTTKYFPHYEGTEIKFNGTYDKYIYFLAACLRFDMAEYAKFDLYGDTGMTCYDLSMTDHAIDELDQPLDLQLVKSYFPRYSLQLRTTALMEEIGSRGIKKRIGWKFLDTCSTEPNPDYLIIDINQGTNHFDTRVTSSIDRYYASTNRVNYVPQSDVEESKEQHYLDRSSADVKKVEVTNPREHDVNAIYSKEYIEQKFRPVVDKITELLTNKDQLTNLEARNAIDKITKINEDIQNFINSQIKLEQLGVYKRKWLKIIADNRSLLDISCQTIIANLVIAIFTIGFALFINKIINKKYFMFFVPEESEIIENLNEGITKLEF